MLTRAKLARAHAVDPTTIDRWVRRGCPVEGAGRAKRYNSAAVIAWRIESAARTAAEADEVLDFEEARARKTTAEAAMAEQELAQRRGELVEIDTVAEVLETTLATIRLRLGSIPAKVAPRVAVLKAAPAARAFLEEEIAEVLGELASGDGFAAIAAGRDREKRTRKARG